MCGIIAIASDSQVSSRLLHALTKLEYRGYDSCGMVTNHDNHLKTLKGVGEIKAVDKKLNFSLLPGLVGIAHTRWATHGAVTNYNTHPFLSADGNFAIVHNGVISNYQSIKDKLLAEKFTFSSETDSEVIVNLLQYNYQKCNSVQQSLQDTLKELQGCYAIAVTSLHEPDTIYGAKYLLPLLLGISTGSIFLCSDIIGFTDYSSQAINIEDNELVSFTKDAYQIYSLPTAKKIKRSALVLTDYDTVVDKGNFAHFMLKEIFDQPKAIQAALNLDDKAIQDVAKLINKTDHTYMVGIGTTYYIAKAGCYILGSQAKVFCSAIPADEFPLQVNKQSNGHCLFISQSGETFDTKEAFRIAKDHRFLTSAIVNAPNSTLARDVDKLIYQNSGLEVSVVSTKAAISQLTILQRLAWELAHQKGLLSADEHKKITYSFYQFSEMLAGKLTQISEECANLAQNWFKFEHFLCLGKGLYYPLALEAALKIKEVAYIHAEGMPTGFLKHGTLALIDKDIPCLFFVPPMADQHLLDSTLSAVQEVKARYGLTIGFAEANNENISNIFSYCFIMPPMDHLFVPIYQLVVTQLLAYHLAIKLKRPIDKPRNLAKSVTVP